MRVLLCFTAILLLSVEHCSGVRIQPLSSHGAAEGDSSYQGSGYTLQCCYIEGVNSLSNIALYQTSRVRRQDESCSCLCGTLRCSFPLPSDCNLACRKYSRVQSCTCGEPDPTTTTTIQPRNTTSAPSTPPPLSSSAPSTESISPSTQASPTTNHVNLSTEKTTTKPLTTSAPSTEPLTNSAPSTESITTSAPSTEPLTTSAPSTEPITTSAPSTEPLTTSAPSTEPLTTSAPSTESITTSAPSTEPLTTSAPSTEPITTSAPSTEPLTTSAPSTESITTSAPSTESITTSAPSTESITTSAPSTESITTSAPSTESITTSAPSTEPLTTSTPSIVPVSSTRPLTTSAPSAQPLMALTTSAPSTSGSITTSAPSTEPITTSAPSTEPLTNSAPSRPISTVQQPLTTNTISTVDTPTSESPPETTRNPRPGNFRETLAARFNKTRRSLQRVFSDVLFEGNFSMSDSIQRLSNLSRVSFLEDLSIETDMLLETFSTLLDSLTNFDRQFNRTSMLAMSGQLLRSVDIFALRIIEPGLYTFRGFSLNVSNVSRTLPAVDGIKIGNNRISIPREALAFPNTETVRIASLLYPDLGSVLTPDNASNESRIISDVISAALLCEDTVCSTSYLELQEPVYIQLDHEELTLGPDEEKKCVFWDFSSDNKSTGEWSDRGCSLVNSTSTLSVCVCNHLTHFAILLSPKEVNISQGNVVALQLIGYIGVSVSLVSLGITVLILTCVRSLWSIRNYIHIHLSLSLIVAHVIFLAGVDKTANTVGCSVVAVLLHYVYLVSFMWMLMEGVVLYVILVRVFIQKSKKCYLALFTVLSYGLPLLYMCVTIPLGFRKEQSEYGYEDACWLRYTSNFIWSFIAPVIVVILINFGFFLMVVVILFKQKSKTKQRTATLASIKSWLKSTISLVVIMGLTWIAGLLFFNEDLLAFAYIFTIFVAFQGMAIFVLFILLSRKVQLTFLKRVRVTVSHSSYLNSHIGGKVNSWVEKIEKSSGDYAKGPQIQLGTQGEDVHPLSGLSTDSTKLSLSSETSSVSLSMDTTTEQAPVHLSKDHDKENSHASFYLSADYIQYTNNHK